MIVKGANRSTICDLQRSNYCFVPNSLTQLFDENDVLNVKKLEKEIEKGSLPVLQEYIDFLIEHEMIFPCNFDEVSNFPKISLDFDYPATISNMIIDFDKNTSLDLKYIINKFCIPSNCRNIELRGYDLLSKPSLFKIAEDINNSFIKTVDIIVNIDFEIDNEFIEWVGHNKKIRNFIIHSQSENKIISSGVKNGFGTILNVKDKVTSSKHCGVINKHNFSLSIETFTESLNHNSCLNRKLSIDKDNNIKNCPALTESFGNIKNTTIDEVLSNENFTKYWNITKDQIEICKDCEFRYICTDCRAYLENPENQYSKPLKCGYDPYKCEWQEWSANPLKQKAIEYYNMQEFV